MIGRLRLWLQRRFLQLLGVAFWLAMILGLYLYLDAQSLTLGELLARFEATMRDHWYGPALYLLAFVFVRPFTLVPAVIFAALGGRLFGVGWGFVYALVGKTLTALLPYYLGRAFARRGMDTTGFTTPGRQQFIRRVALFLQRNAFESLLAMRLINLPFDIVSFIAGTIRVRWRVFMLATFLGNISDVYAFVALGASVEGDLMAQEIHINAELVASSVIVLLVSAGIALVLRRRQAQLEAEELARLR